VTPQTSTLRGGKAGHKREGKQREIEKGREGRKMGTAHPTIFGFKSLSDF